MLVFFKKYYKIILFLGIIAILLFSPLKNMINTGYLSEQLSAIKGTPYAPLIYVIVYIIGVVAALPGIVLTALSGPLFGFWKGAILVIIGSNLGCQLTFFISRYMGRDFIGRFIKDESFADKISKKIEQNGLLVMLYLRLLPIFPFNGVNYLSGLTNIKHSHYTLATFVGMLPGTLVYVYLSATVAEVKTNPMGVVISVGLLIVFTIITAVLKKIKKI
jgi:uncharacterized membrane protein YdjX (TVP38/TMEM64 family)